MISKRLLTPSNSFNALDMLGRYRAETWFNLGDRDLATHIRRTHLLKQGATLSEATAELCQRLGVDHKIVPMSDEPVRTVLSTEAGDLAMHQYFVQHRSEPRVTAIAYAGTEGAAPSSGLRAALESARLAILCPSNPYLSLGPILAVPGVRQGLETFPGLRVAVSPIVGGEALRGPAAKIMAELGHEVSSVGVARQYQGISDIFLIDRQDAGLEPAIAGLGIRPVATSIIMGTDADKVALAKYILGLVSG